MTKSMMEMEREGNGKGKREEKRNLKIQIWTKAVRKQPYGQAVVSIHDTSVGIRPIIIVILILSSPKSWENESIIAAINGLNQYDHVPWVGTECM